METKIITIVGMGQGIGLGIARRFGKEGFVVVMVARNEAKLKLCKESLEEEGITSHYFLADATNEASLLEAFELIHAQVGYAEILVYNAAALKMGNILHETTDTLVDDFKVNVCGALSAVKVVLPYMRERKEGKIFLTGGGFAIQPSHEFGSLSLGKAGIRSLNEQLYNALRDEGIHVASVTVCGMVNKKDPRYNPDSIAENYWTLYGQQKGDFEKEIIY
ncbi:SDR family NAD(P)-dependent oxidoreductase [Limibacter armeniacum]|uniref:SDR family NAD(P)-dependent oxidoreductase n=1 Tax=Limibacter armeniacum TaxID=466084 RepID=UPI002FE63D53